MNTIQLKLKINKHYENEFSNKNYHRIQMKQKSNCSKPPIFHHSPIVGQFRNFYLLEYNKSKQDPGNWKKYKISSATQGYGRSNLRNTAGEWWEEKQKALKKGWQELKVKE